MTSIVSPPSSRAPLNPACAFISWTIRHISIVTLSMARLRVTILTTPNALPCSHARFWKPRRSWACRTFFTVTIGSPRCCPCSYARYTLRIRHSAMRRLYSRSTTWDIRDCFLPRRCPCSCCLGTCLPCRGWNSWTGQLSEGGAHVLRLCHHGQQEI